MSGSSPFFRTGTAMWQNGCESAAVPVINTPLVAPGPNPNTPTRGLIPTAAGNLIVTMADGTTCTLVVPATGVGIFLPLAITMVNTSSTATAVAFW